MKRQTEDGTAGSSEQGRFLERWSRRKQAAQKRNLAVESESAAELLDACDEPSVNEKSRDATPPLTDADMPSLEDLGDDSDYAGFLSTDVSEELRRMALRKLFHSAQFNICDGLDDYDEDFTSFEKLGDIVTADMKYRMGREEQKEVAEPAMLESKIEEEIGSPKDEPAQKEAANELVEMEKGEDAQSARSGEYDNEIDTQSNVTPVSVVRSSS